MVDSFIFFQSYYDAICALDTESQLSLFHAMCEYVYRDKVPNLTGASSGMWALIKPLLDSSMSKRQARQEAGRKGGMNKGEANVKQNESKPQAKVKQTASKSEANEKQSESKPQGNSNCNSNSNCNKKENLQKKFVPPTLEEVKAYVRERNSPVNAETFFEYFTKGNWVDSKGNKVLNWKQKLITWEKYQAPDQKPKLSSQKDFIQGGLSDDLLDRLEASAIKKAQ